eukprot:jgi/Mesvir1/11631/Mv00034-RA.1
MTATMSTANGGITHGTHADGPTTAVRTEKAKPLVEQPSCTHHRPDGKGYHNPWESFGGVKSFGDFFILRFKDWDSKRSAAPPKDERHPVRPVDMERVNSYGSTATSSNPQSGNSPEKGMLLTWLGHAAFHLALKSGVNILFDPCCSQRCSPLTFAGPSRITPVPAKVEELKTDVIIISHNHYDHLDVQTLKNLDRNITCFVPLGCGKLFRDLNYAHVYELDWWDTYHHFSAGAAPESRPLEITCTPCQHFSGRSLFDHNKSLWASWSLRTPANQTVFFGGDTGYRSVPRDFCGDLDSLPHCPAFRHIGDTFGGFDLACIPIGAYSPRWFMSPIHAAPEDSVCIHQDIKSRLSVGMHFGTFILTDEPVKEPPLRLRAACRAKGIADDAFRILDIGESLEV